MYLGVSVHMGTMGVLWAPGRGQNSIAESKNDFSRPKMLNIEQ